jgi:hypothetical protein
MHFLTGAFFRRKQRPAWPACGLAAWLFLAAATLADVASSPDGVVTLNEIADYVATRVPELTVAASERPHHPTVSPAILLPFMTPPLAEHRDGRPAP